MLELFRLREVAQLLRTVPETPPGLERPRAFPTERGPSERQVDSSAGTISGRGFRGYSREAETPDGRS